MSVATNDTRDNQQIFCLSESESDSEEECLSITLRTEDASQNMTTPPNALVGPTVREALPHLRDCSLVCSLGGVPISSGLSFHANGVSSNATLTVQVTGGSPKQVAQALYKLHPGMHRYKMLDRLLQHMTLNQDGTVKDWELQPKGLWMGETLHRLPESIGQLTVTRNLALHHNSLEELPESIGGLTVGGNLLLQGNPLKSLPDSFRNITVGGKIFLPEELRMSRQPGELRSADHSQARLDDLLQGFDVVWISAFAVL